MNRCVTPLYVTPARTWWIWAGGGAYSPFMAGGEALVAVGMSCQGGCGERSAAYSQRGRRGIERVSTSRFADAEAREMRGMT